MPGWDPYLSDRDKELFELGGFGRSGGYGERPVVLVVDVSYAFTGDRPASILESIVEWPNSCGAGAWDGVRNIATLLDAARAKRLPVFYTTGYSEPVGGGDFGLGRWKDKLGRETEDAGRAAIGNRIVDEIAPQENDIVIEKGKPSAFFGPAARRPAAACVPRSTTASHTTTGWWSSRSARSTGATRHTG
jgi:maleamate amidohydrolase